MTSGGQEVERLEAQVTASPREILALVEALHAQGLETQLAKAGGRWQVEVRAQRVGSAEELLDAVMEAFECAIGDVERAQAQVAVAGRRFRLRRRRDA